MGSAFWLEVRGLFNQPLHSASEICNREHKPFTNEPTNEASTNHNYSSIYKRPFFKTYYNSSVSVSCDIFSVFWPTHWPFPQNFNLSPFKVSMNTMKQIFELAYALTHHTTVRPTTWWHGGWQERKWVSFQHPEKSLCVICITRRSIFYISSL